MLSLTAKQEREIRVVVIAAEGDVFCGGGRSYQAAIRIQCS